jgi:hypothetical protein
MQYKDIFALEAAKFSHERLLVEFSPKIHNFASLERAPNGVPSVAEVNIHKIPHGATRMQYSRYQAVLDIFDSAILFARKPRRENNMIEQ